jgi:hypothetical protein
LKYEAATGSITRLVMILKATPSEAVMASSRTIGMGISTSVTKDTKAVTSASTPGISRPLKLARQASKQDLPRSRAR